MGTPIPKVQLRITGKLQELIRVGEALTPVASLERFNNWVDRATEILGKRAAEINVGRSRHDLGAEIQRGTAAAGQKVTTMFAQVGSELPSDFPLPGTIDLEDFFYLVTSDEPVSEAVHIAQTGHLLELQRGNVLQLEEMLDRYLAAVKTTDNPTGTREARNRLADVHRIARLLVLAQEFLAVNDYAHVGSPSDRPRAGEIDVKGATVAAKPAQISAVRRRVDGLR